MYRRTLATLGVAVWLAAPLAAAERDCDGLEEILLPMSGSNPRSPPRARGLPTSSCPQAVDSRSSKATVPHCRVEGVIGSEIRFEVLLPDAWNGKFLMGGGGGFVGSLGFQGRFSVNRGYATAATDTGHQGPGIRADWAYRNPERMVNYGYLGVHRTTEVAKAIVRSYYGRQAERSYFYGCSNGGRQGDDVPPSDSRRTSTESWPARQRTTSVA